MSQWPQPGYAVLTTTTAFSGVSCMTFTQQTGGGDAYSNSFAVVPNTTYYMHAAYMTLGGGGYLGIEMFDASMTFLSEEWMFGDGSW